VHGRAAGSEHTARYPATVRGPNTTLLASMSVEGIGPSLAVEGETTAPVFELYIGKVLLAPSLQPGQVVVMDNLSAHKGERI
jgi:hypothetical protein